MKIECQHRTTAIGTDAEYYFGGLTGLYNNPNGKYRPDFITKESKFKPRLSLELKSGRNRKGILCDYQLRYATTLYEDYGELFGEKIKNEEIAYYYGLLCRKDDIAATEFEKPFSTIRLTWGDQFILPGEMGFYTFVIRDAIRKVKQSQKYAERARKYKKKIPEIFYPETIIPNVISRLRYMIKNKFDENGNSWSSHPNKDSMSWQGLDGRDLEAIFHKEYSIASKEGNERIRLLEIYYPSFNKLARIKIPSTEDSQIYVLCEREHEDLFDKQFKRIVESNKSKMEKLIEERKNAIYLIDEIRQKRRRVELEKDLFDENDERSYIYEKYYSLEDLTEKEIKLLRRLSFWAVEGQSLPAYLNDGREILDSYEPEDGEVLTEPNLDTDIPF